jgi:hypothetical protein
MSKVVAFRDTILVGDPNPEIIEILEKLLEDARSGELRGIAYASCKVGDVTATGWNGSDGSRHPLSTAISVLNSRWSRALYDDHE